jgi:tetratricopeptide (TPR) repeat protein
MYQFNIDFCIDFLFSLLDNESKEILCKMSFFNSPFTMDLTKLCFGISDDKCRKLFGSGFFKKIELSTHIPSDTSNDLINFMHHYIRESLSKKIQINYVRDEIYKGYKTFLYSLQQNIKDNPRLKQTVLLLLRKNKSNNIESLIDKFKFEDKNEYILIVADLLFAISQFERALIYYEMSHELRTDDKIKIKIAICKSKIGKIHESKSDLEGMVSQYEKQMNNESRNILYDLYISLCYIYRDTGNHKKSIECLEKSLTLNNSLQSVAKFWHIKGTIIRNIGQFDQALECFNKAVESYLCLPNQEYHLNKTKRNIGITKWMCGDFKESIQILEESNEYDIENQNEVDIARNEINLGMAYARLREFDKAKFHLMKGFYIDKKYFHTVTLARDYLIIGIVNRFKGELEDALKYLWTGFLFNTFNHNTYGSHYALYYMGIVYRDMGKINNARYILENIKASQSNENNPFLYSGILRNLAICYKDLGAYVKIHKEILEVSKKINAEISLKETTSKLSKIYCDALGLIQKANELDKDSKFNKSKNKYIQATILKDSGRKQMCEHILQILKDNDDDVVMKSRIVRHLSDYKYSNECVMMLLEIENQLLKEGNALQLSKIYLTIGKRFLEDKEEQALVYLKKSLYFIEDLQYYDDLLLNYLYLVKYYLWKNNERLYKHYFFLAISVYKDLEIEKII